MNPNDWDHTTRLDRARRWLTRQRPLTINRQVPAVSGLMVLKWAVFFVLATAMLLYVMASN